MAILPGILGESAYPQPPLTWGFLLPRRRWGAAAPSSPRWFWLFTHFTGQGTLTNTVTSCGRRATVSFLLLNKQSSKAPAGTQGSPTSLTFPDPAGPTGLWPRVWPQPGAGRGPQLAISRGRLGWWPRSPQRVQDRSQMAARKSRRPLSLRIEPAASPLGRE